MKKIIIIALAISIVFAATLSANGSQEAGENYGGGRGYESGEGKGQGPRDGSGRGAGQGSGQGAGRGNSSGQLYRENFTEELKVAYGKDLGQGVLSSEEKEGLLLMIEEEKLARDVYMNLYEKWNLPVFSNIANSEQQHMDAVGSLLEAYEVSVPAQLSTAGLFQNSTLQNHYNNLTKEGASSLEAALTVGATIEDLDIADLQKLIEKADNDEVKLLYQNLMKGSRNHMRSFTAQLDRYETNYEPVFISADYYEKILRYNRESAVITDPDYSL